MCLSSAFICGAFWPYWVLSLLLSCVPDKRASLTVPTEGSLFLCLAFLCQWSSVFHYLSALHLWYLTVTNDSNVFVLVPHLGKCLNHQNCQCALLPRRFFQVTNGGLLSVVLVPSARTLQILLAVQDGILFVYSAGGEWVTKPHFITHFLRKFLTPPMCVNWSFLKSIHYYQIRNARHLLKDVYEGDTGRDQINESLHVLCRSDICEKETDRKI